MELSFDHDQSEQIVITPELLALLRHIVDNHAMDLKKLVALVKRTQHRSSADESESESFEQAQSSIIEFLGLMEIFANEVSREHATTHQVQQHIMPSINHIDISACADDLVRESADQATNQLKLDPKKNPQELLFKELLKRWKPNKKNAAH